MSGFLGPGRRMSDDGHLLIADDMVAPALALLEKASAEYGPVHWDGWTLGGVVFFGDNPSVRPLTEARQVVIVLPDDGTSDMDMAQFCLAHEVIHCLHLNGEHRPPMIEEGAAVRFSLVGPEYSIPEWATRARDWQMRHPGGEHYAEALVAVERLLGIEPEAIRRLRGENPDWSAVTAERILAVAPECPPELAATLAEVREMRPDSERETARAMMAGAGR